MMQQFEEYRADKEIEIKLKLDENNLIILERWLKDNAIYTQEDTQEEYYLNPQDLSWFKTHPEGYKYALQYLRVRISPFGDTLCYKDWTSSVNSDATALYCTEKEVNITDGYKMLELLKCLGYSNCTTFKKRRQNFTYNNIEISIDTVDNLGVFVEFEIKKRTYKEDLEEYAALKNFINSIGFSKYHIQTQGFIILLWNPDFNWT